MSRMLAVFLILCADFSVASVCNQKIYDNLYAAISRQAIDEAKKDLAQALDTRAAEIRVLRELCRGQRSSYERGQAVPRE